MWQMKIFHELTIQVDEMGPDLILLDTFDGFPIPTVTLCRLQF